MGKGDGCRKRIPIKRDAIKIAKSKLQTLHEHPAYSMIIQCFGLEYVCKLYTACARTTLRGYRTQVVFLKVICTMQK